MVDAHALSARLDDLTLDEASRTALVAIVRSPTCYATVPALEASGVFLDALAELRRGGLVVDWPGTVPPSVTLTPLAAERLAVEIIEDAREEPSWEWTGVPPKPLRATRWAHHHTLELPELIVDPAPSPLEFLIDCESGNPVKLFGRVVPRDGRLKPGTASKPAKGRKPKGKASKRRKAKPPRPSKIRAALDAIKNGLTV